MSQPYLVIVESPHRAKLLNALFSGQLLAMPTYGQVCALVPPDGQSMAIDRDTLLGRYALTHDPRRHIDGRRAVEQIQQFMAAHPGTMVYLGMENDQAGETLSAYLAHFLKLRSPRRLRLNAYTQPALDEALRSAGRIDQDAVNAQVARLHIDHIAAATIGPCLRGVAGPVLPVCDRLGLAVDALVMERERAISDHQVGARHFAVHLDMGGWSAQWQCSPTPGPDLAPERNAQFDDSSGIGLCLDAPLAHQVSQQRALLVQSFNEYSETELAPSALTTEGLLSVAGRVLGWPPDKIHQVAQQLHEGDGGPGHITAPRSGVTTIALAVAASMHAWLREQGLPVPDTPNTGAHPSRWFLKGSEAIRPTNWQLEEAGATDDQRALYALIRERALYSQLAPATYTTQEALLTDARGQHTFIASSHVLLAPGWLDTTAVQSPAIDARALEPSANPMPYLQQGAFLNVRGATVREQIPAAQPRYTPETLLAKLQTIGLMSGLGQPEFARVLRSRGSIALRTDGSIEPTAMGLTSYAAVYPRYGFAHLAYAVELEQALDRVASGELAGPGLLRTVWDRLNADAAAVTL